MSIYGKKGFTLVELLVVISIIAMLLAVLMPSLSRVREHAKTVVCRSNLKQMALVFNCYVNDNDGKFHYGWDYSNKWYPEKRTWPWALEKYFPDDKAYFCPSASKVRQNTSVLGGFGGREYAWQGIDWLSEPPKNISGKYTSGSYGFNGWLWPQEGENNQFWKKYQNISTTYNVPVLVDSYWLHFAPFDTAKPPSEKDKYAAEPGLPSQYTDAYTYDQTSMHRVCLDRHHGAVCVIFADFSVRLVNLKSLWSLKWSKNFDTTVKEKIDQGRNGGWPLWMNKR